MSLDLLLKWGSRLLPRVPGGGVWRHRGLFVAWQNVRRAFPWRHEIEIAEFLHQLHRLIDHPLQFFVIAKLDKAREREILAQRIPGKAVIGENAAQIRIALKRDAIHVEGFALEP